MTLRTLASDEARTKWRDLLDAVSAGEDGILIERFGKPTAVVIGLPEYEKYREAVALLAEIAQLGNMEAVDELLEQKIAKRRVQEFLDNPSIGKSYAEYKQKMIVEGILSE